MYGPLHTTVSLCSNQSLLFPLQCKMTPDVLKNKRLLATTEFVHRICGYPFTLEVMEYEPPMFAYRYGCKNNRK